MKTLRFLKLLTVFAFVNPQSGKEVQFLVLQAIERVLKDYYAKKEPNVELYFCGPNSQTGETKFYSKISNQLSFDISVWLAKSLQEHDLWHHMDEQQRSLAKASHFCAENEISSKPSTTQPLMLLQVSCSLPENVTFITTKQSKDSQLAPWKGRTKTFEAPTC